MKKVIKRQPFLNIWKPIKIKPVSPVRVSIYPRRNKQEWRLIDTKPYRDKDKDRVMNWFDCKPLKKRKQDFGPFKPQGREVEELTAAERFGTRNIKHLKKLGQGRDRVVYRLDKNKVLKIAKNPGGVAQNIMESDLGGYLDELKHYETGKDYVVTEKVQKLSPILRKRVSKMLKDIEQRKLMTGLNPNVIASYSLESEEPEKRLINPSLKDYDLSEDILKLSSWGEKEGRPVVIDAGALSRTIPLREHRITRLKKQLQGQEKVYGYPMDAIPKSATADEIAYLKNVVNEWQDIQRERKKFVEKGKEESSIPEYHKGGLEFPEGLQSLNGGSEKYEEGD